MRWYCVSLSSRTTGMNSPATVSIAAGIEVTFGTG